MPHALLSTRAARVTASLLGLTLIATGTGLLPVAAFTTNGATQPVTPPIAVPPVTPITPTPIGPPAPTPTPAITVNANGQSSQGGLTLSAALGHAQLVREGDGLVALHCGVDVSQDAAVADRERLPIDMALILDVSGSMEGAMPLLRQATRGIVDRLGPQDRLTVVTYSNSARVIYRGLPQVDGADALRGAIARLNANGGTNLSSGLQAAIQALAASTGRASHLLDGPTDCREEIVRKPGDGYGCVPVERCGNEEPDVVRQARIVVLTDGLANQGVTDPYGLRRIVQGARNAGLSLSSLGLGNEFNEQLLGDLADAGGGRYHYANRPEGLNAVYKAEVDAAQQMVATNVSLVIEPQQGVRVEQVHSWKANPSGQSWIVPLGDLARGRKLKVVARLKVPTGEADAVDAVRVRLQYSDPTSGAAHTVPAVALGVGLTDDTTVAQASVDREVAKKVAEVQVAENLSAAREKAEAGRLEEAKALIRQCAEVAESDSVEFETAAGDDVVLDFELADELDGAPASSERARAALKRGYTAGNALGR